LGGPMSHFTRLIPNRLFTRQTDGLLIYIWLASVELALSRVQVRVQQGGHSVSAETVERRYWRGLRNFFRLYRPVADTWTLCDNSREELIVVARCSRGQEPEILEPQGYRRMHDQVAHGHNARQSARVDYAAALALKPSTLSNRFRSCRRSLTPCFSPRAWKKPASMRETVY